MSPMNTVLRLVSLAVPLSLALSSYAHSPPQSNVVSSLASDNCTCTLIPKGRGQDDASAIAEILSHCGQNGSTVCFPNPYVYTIGSALETYVNNATILLEGTFQFSPNLTYWLNNSFPVELQNQVSAWRFHGENFVLDGGESYTGVLDGNGQIWYTYSAGGSNTPGRPMTLDIYGSRNGVLKNLLIYQPQFWAIIIEGSENIRVENVEVFAENTDPAAKGSNWVQNTDGADTWRSTNITFSNFTYTGGDDCIAFKGNSTSVHLRNITCHGGPGIAFGSVGQYPDQPDYLTDITIDGAHINRPTYSGVGIGQGLGAGVYFKSWIGVPIGTPPNGGGGGGGAVNNVSITNINVTDVDLAIYINSCLSYILTIDPTADPNKYCNTSTLTYNNISFSNFYGTTSGEYGGVVAQLNCSTAAPCTELEFTNFNVVPAGVNGTGQSAAFSCQNVVSIDGETCS